ncbi:MAG: phosphotransferase [Gaiellales bacterium]
MNEEALTGGNTHAGVVRVGDTVRRPAGPWTPSVHAVLRHLEAVGFDASPRVHGTDEQGREILDYVEGIVVHPDHDGLVHGSDRALAEVARVIRRYHDAVEGLSLAGGTWHDNGRDPVGPTELVCHNDLATWNLVLQPDGGWAFIDWDLVAPGRRAWDVSWALLSLIPLMPHPSTSDPDIARRLACFREAYGADHFPGDVLEVAAERCEHEAGRIGDLGAAGFAPYDRLLAEGHGEIWSDAARHVRERLPAWRDAVL